jgi:hypothetical protein
LRLDEHTLAARVVASVGLPQEHLQFLITSHVELVDPILNRGSTRSESSTKFQSSRWHFLRAMASAGRAIVKAWRNRWRSRVFSKSGLCSSWSGRCAHVI